VTKPAPSTTCCQSSHLPRHVLQISIRPSFSKPVRQAVSAQRPAIEDMRRASPPSRRHDLMSRALPTSDSPSARTTILTHHVGRCNGIGTGICPARPGVEESTLRAKAWINTQGWTTRCCRKWCNMKPAAKQYNGTLGGQEAFLVRSPAGSRDRRSLAAIKVGRSPQKSDCPHKSLRQKDLDSEEATCVN
jgi:hypothetical protein